MLEQQHGLEIYVEGTNILVNFEQLLPGLEKHHTAINLFPLGKKRIYVGIIEAVASELYYVFSYDESFIQKYYEISSDIYEYGQYLKDNELKCLQYQQSLAKGIPIDYNPKKFYNELLTFSEGLYSYYHHLIEETFDLTLDDDYKDELLFEASHIKIILAVSGLIKFMIPLIMSYAATTGIKDSDVIISDLVITYLGKFADFYETKIDIANKLYKLISSRVHPTIFSDRIIWQYLTNIGTTPPEYIASSFRKILTDHLPKLTVERNPIIYFHVVLRNIIKYQFSTKFPISYKPLLTVRDNNETTVFDSIHTSNMRPELDVSLQRLYVKETIAKLLKDTREITPAEYSYYYDRLEVRNAHTILMNAYYSKELCGAEIIQSASSSDYYKLLIIFLEAVNEAGYTKLYKALLSNPTHTGVVNKSKVKPPKIVIDFSDESIELREQLYNKFTTTDGRLQKTRIVEKVLIELLLPNRVTIPTYSSNDVPAPLNLDNDDIIVEALTFLNNLTT